MRKEETETEPKKPENFAVTLTLHDTESSLMGNFDTANLHMVTESLVNLSEHGADGFTLVVNPWLVLQGPRGKKIKPNQWLAID